MNIIAAVDKNWAIGKDNRLLVRISEDMRFFKEKTTGHTVVMGRKTLESFPNKKPLPNRTNIVMTRDDHYKAEGVTVVHSESELWEQLGDCASDEIFVIGGAEIYGLLLDACDTAYITKIDAAYDADAYFPNLDKRDEWTMVEESETKTASDVTYTFARYEKNKG